MQVRRRAGHVEIWAPAKINLFFEVLSRRDDGFHEIESLMVPIRLFDTLIVADDPSGRVTLEAGWASGLSKTTDVAAHGARHASDTLGELPPGDENIAVRAIRLLAERAHVQRGATLRLTKRIPSAAGLGGGSADAAAALCGANLAWDLRWSAVQLALLAAELGSDVPFFFAGGPAICRGRGEKVEPVAGLRNLHFVVVRPPEGLSTARVYAACRPGGRIAQAAAAAQTLRGPPVSERLAHNRLLAAAREMSPCINRTLTLLAAHDFQLFGMSGSGTSCFGLCRSAWHARTLAARLRAVRPAIGHVWYAASA